jgi:hypothetical protein
LLLNCAYLWVKVKRVCNKSHSRLRIRRRGLQASGEQACIQCPVSDAISNPCLHRDLRRGQLQRRSCCHARCPLLAAPPSDAAVSAEGVPIPAANTHGLICVRKAAASCDAMITVTSSAANSSSPRDMVSDVVRPRPCPLPVFRPHCAGPLLQHHTHITPRATCNTCSRLPCPATPCISSSSNADSSNNSRSQLCVN